MRRLVLGLAIVASCAIPTLLVAQAKPAAPAKAPPAPAPVQKIDLVTVSGIDYAFALPQVLSAGTITFNLVNNGEDVHAMTLLQLPDNHTMRDFLDTYHRGGIIPAWMTTLGQTSTIAPKQEAFLTARLKPGKYVLACLIPTRDGRAHTEKGMVQSFSVK
ncbi:MAG: hypothetical protein K2R93_01120 [Gemmatimonadaceae bacterium]|nr:hypothetical protein [Gemmatimonadaceae bacterium]